MNNVRISCNVVALASICVIAIGALNLIGHLLGIPQKFQWGTIGMAMSTAIALILLGACDLVLAIIVENKTKGTK